MTVQEEPLALDGPAAAPWPVQLEPMDVGSEESACYPGWEFRRAGWTASGRSFEARVGLGPESSGEDREALFAAFDSMTFAETGEAPASVIIASGVIGGEDYQLVASSGPEGLVLGLQGQSFGFGSGGAPVSEALQMFTHEVGGVDLVFGAVPADAVRVVRTGGFSAQTEYAIIDVPDEIDPGANAFLAVGGEGDTFEVFDAEGNAVAHGSLGAEEAQPPAPLGDRRHFGYVRSVDADARTIEFDLAYWLSGEEANQAYQEATGDTGPVPNDHFVVNDNPLLRTFSLASDVRLRLLDWNNCCDTLLRRRPRALRGGDRGTGGRRRRGPALPGTEPVVDHDRERRRDRDRGAVLAVTATGSRRGRSRRRCSPRTRLAAHRRSAGRSRAP
jgi:hypothetical protein